MTFMVDMVEKVIGLAVGLFVLAALIPSAITLIVNANTTDWGANNIAIWGVVSIIVIVGVVLMILKTAKGR